MNRSDLLIVFGASFSNHTSISTKRPTIQIDFDRMMLGKFHEVHYPLWGEIGATLRYMHQRVTEKQHPERRAYVARLWEQWRTEKENRAKTYGGEGRVPNARIFQIMSDIVFLPQN